MDLEKKIKALVLCGTLGMFGVHRFYLGKPVTATLQIILTLTLLGIYVNAVWLVVDINRIAFDSLTDK